MRALKWGAAILVALLFLLGFAGAAYWSRVLPQTEGVLEVKGMPNSALGGELRIERDRHGIPTIHATSRDAALYGLGFVHAQDRLWQLETHRRISAGRLAEVFGVAALETDKFLRALGVRREAAKQWKHLDVGSKRAVESYTAGINAFISGHLRARPPEYLILGFEPELWTVEDTMAWPIMMAWDLGGNWTTELLRMRLALTLKGPDVPARINRILLPYPGEAALKTRDYAALYRQLKADSRLGQLALLHAPESGVVGVGSNSWVVAGARTESGKPLLANDPHLKLTTPALWYFARIDVTGEQHFRISGATMPGLPAVALGQNDHIAWGFTNTNPDVQDLYLEQIKADDPGRYRTPGGWEKFQTFDETIKVKGQPSVKLVTRATRHGPVISDADSAVTREITQEFSGGRYALALRWTALDNDASAMPAALALSRAVSVTEFIAAAQSYVAPMQNMVVADVKGNIGMVAAGRVPLRKPENDLKGLVPAPGWEARYDWAGFLDPARTPREINPARGWIATANHRIHPANYPYYLTSEWLTPERQNRIERLLAAQTKHTKASLQAIQADQVSLATQRLLPVVRRAKPTHPLGGEALKLLATFDGNMRAGESAPLIFAAWAREMARAVFADELGGDEAYYAQVGRRVFRAGLEAVLLNNDADWCDDIRTPAKETCTELVSRSLDRALAELESSQGSVINTWQWGRVHQARSEHRPFSKVKPLARWFELRVSTGGDNYTVNVARYSLKGEEPYLNEHAPSLRAIYDLANPAASGFMHSTGQSGIVLSDHFDDFVRPWAEVKDVPVWASADSGGSRPSTRTLVLRPAAVGYPDTK